MPVQLPHSRDTSDSLPVVNSHEGWSRLEEVIVGIPYHLDYHDDVSFKLFFHENLKEQGGKLPDGTAPSKRVQEESMEDRDGLVGILETEGVIVKGPQVVTEIKEISTPFWSAPLNHALMPRDLFIVVGNEIIECSPQVRARKFEPELYREVFTEYFSKGAKWTVAPASRLLDANFDYRYALEHGYEPPPVEESFYEIMFDGAQIMRLGRDLFFNVANENHRMGLTWLQRHLRDQYQVHEVAIADYHIDGLILPLRPGVLLVRRGVDLSQFPWPLRQWKIIYYDKPESPPIDDDGLPILASESIGMNVLSIDETKVIVQDIQIPLMRALEEEGFTPIPCRWRHGRTLGGGFHCVTLDIRRRSKLESYID